MYEMHFGMRQRPFRSLSDSGSYYPATSHEQALSDLQRIIVDDESLALLTGEPGMGKTLLGHCLLDRLGEEVGSAFLTHSHASTRTDLLQAILYDLSLPHEGKGEQELRLTLTNSLLKNYEAGRRTILLIDEAQHLTPDLLEELRLLGNLEGRNGKALQIILLALPTIQETLRRPELAAFQQRLAVHARLEPLGLHEAADYLVHHLRAAGARVESLVADEALEILARGTHGIPRLLNRAAHQALRLAYSAGATTLDAEAALEALAGLGLTEAEGDADEIEMLGEAVSTSVLSLDAKTGVDDPSSAAPCEADRSRRLSVSPRRPA